jgi:hypothetical protein
MTINDYAKSFIHFQEDFKAVLLKSVDRERYNKIRNFNFVLFNSSLQLRAR